MSQLNFNLLDEQQTSDFGAYLAKHVFKGLVIGLQGQIGAGKTCLVRACLKALGVLSSVKSPTFTLVESYLVQGFEIHHFDLYRLSSSYELEDLGFRDYISENSISFIEWPEKAPIIMPFIDFMIELSLQLPGRQICLSARSGRGEDFINQLQRKKWLG
jgi:tRNA threonylcarbamoyladenosine biosynthesis protein TsaE